MPRKSILIAGKGPSAYQYHYPDDVPIMAVSGGFDPVPHIDHFVSLDKPSCFPQWVLDGDTFEKHVPNNRFLARWTKHPRITVWNYIAEGDPDFTGKEPIVSGPLPRNYSLLMAVQVAAHLGFNRCVFIGVDLLENELWPIADVLRDWYPAAQAAGIEWVNASPISTLCEWMPSASESELLTIGEFRESGPSRNKCNLGTGIHWLLEVDGYGGAP